MRTKPARRDRGLTVTRAVLLISAVGLLGVLAYRQISRLVSPTSAVWVAATDIAAGQPVTGARLRLARTASPVGALVNRSDIENRTLAIAKAGGQPFYPRDLIPKPLQESLSGTVPPGRLLATVRVEAMDLPVAELRKGDRLDIIQAGPDGIRVVAHDAFVMGVLDAQSAHTPKAGGAMVMGVDISNVTSRSAVPAGSSLVLALFPRDVFPMAAAEATQRRMKIVLHSMGEVRSGSLLSVVPAPPKAAPDRAARSNRATPGGMSVEVLTAAGRETLFFPTMAPRASANGSAPSASQQ